jgi:hypothetical protein
MFRNTVYVLIYLSQTFKAGNVCLKKIVYFNPVSGPSRKCGSVICSPGIPHHMLMLHSLCLDTSLNQYGYVADQ